MSFTLFTGSELNWSTFWTWSYFRDYLTVVSVFVAVYSLLMFLFINSTLFVELTGLASLLLESMLGLPQALNNYRQQSTEGMRLIISLPFCMLTNVASPWSACGFLGTSSRRYTI